MEKLTNTTINEEILKAAPLLNVSGLSQDIGRTVVVAPHPDDEALGCGGLISLLRSQDAEVHVVFTTNGGASHPNSKVYDSANLQTLRKKEAIRSCKVLGVTEEKVHFIGLQDSKLDQVDESQKAHFINTLNAIFEASDFDSLVTTWRKDAHSDHRATFKLCSHFLKQREQRIQLIEFPIWLWKNGNPEDYPTYAEVEPFRLNIQSVRDIKQKAIHQHKSQTTRLIDDDPDGFILTEDLLEPFAGNLEYFLFTLPQERDTLSRNYFSRLYEEHEDPWNFKDSDYERKKYHKTLEFLENHRYRNALEIGCSIGEHSNLISNYCEQLTAIDISPKAIKTAKENYGDKPIDFKVWNVKKGLPKGKYDLVTLCEVGYYLNQKDLTQLFKDIDSQLVKNGYILLVHWTSYVRDYPLTGRQVHQIFAYLNFVKERYTIRASFEHARYELFMWQKNIQS